MREYPDSPKKIEVYDRNNTQKLLEEIIEEDLPECFLNEWFIESVYFANMIDKILIRLKDEK